MRLPPSTATGRGLRAIVGSSQESTRRTVARRAAGRAPAGVRGAAGRGTSALACSGSPTSRRSRMAEQPSSRFPSELFGLVGEAIALVVEEVTGDRMRVRWTVGPAVHQPDGILHGGIHSWVVETVASVAAATWFGD